MSLSGSTVHPRRVLTALVAIATISAGCSQVTAPPPTTVRPPAQSASVPATQVRRGDVQEVLGYSGEIRAKSQIAVLPKATGRIERVLVDVGSRVRAGEVLAELEQDSPVLQVMQARAAVAVAEAKVAQLQAGPRVQDLASADAMVAAQQAAVQAAEARLAGVQHVRPESVAQAQAALDAARARLSLVQKGAMDDARTAAFEQLSADRAALSSAESALAALGNGSAADVQQVQSQVTTVRSQVTAAEAALANLPGSSAADLQAAESALDTAGAQREAARAALEQNRKPIDAQVLQLEAAIKQAQAALEGARAQQKNLEEGYPAVGSPCGNSASGANSATCDSAKEAARVSEAAAEKALEAAEAQVTLLKKGGSPAQQAQLIAAVDSAEAQVRSAQARLAAIKNGGIEAQRAGLQAQLTAARESLKAAEARLTAVRGSSVEAQRQALVAQAVGANARLQASTARFEEIEKGAREEDVLQAEAAVTQAEQQLALAMEPATANDVRAQQAQVEQGRQGVVQARAQASKARAPFTDQDLQVAEASTEQARAALALAELGIKETTVVAPVDGIVQDRLVSPGALVGPGQPLFQLVPPALELVVSVEEGRLGQVTEGQQVELQVSAFPNTLFRGIVKTISPAIDPKTRTATVRIEPQDDGRLLRSGMFSQLQIVTARKDGVLLLPKEALPGGSAGKQMTVLAIEEDNRVKKVPVRLGLVGDAGIEVVSGLREGQLVVTGNTVGLNDGDLVTPQVETRTASTQEGPAS